MSKKRKADTTIQADLDFKTRVAEWVDEDQKAEEEKKNRNFFMMFKQHGSPAVRKMIRLNGIAAELFLFIAENMDKSNALVGSGKAFAAALGTSEASISRALKVLDEEGYIARFKSGGSNVIVANPDLVWNSWATGKEACLFSNAKVLISKGEQDSTLIRKFAHMLPKVEQTNQDEIEKLNQQRRSVPPLATPAPDPETQAQLGQVLDQLNASAALRGAAGRWTTDKADDETLPPTS